MDKKTEQSFLEAYEVCGDAIYRHCYFRVFSRERAEELTQETFLKTWEYLSKGEKIRESIRPLLYQIATNLIIDDSRKKKMQSLDALLEVSDANEPADEWQKDIEKQFLWKELKRDMDKLNEEERGILVMRYVDDLDIKEIAEILKISSNHVSVKINRATKSLSAEVHGEEAAENNK